MKRILITGGAGFIGTSLCSFFVQNGFYVRVLDFSRSALEKLSRTFAEIDIIQGDVRHPPMVDAALRSMDYVIHLAANSSVPLSFENPKETFEINVTGTLNVLEAALRNQIKRTIVTSSCSVYGDPPAPVPLSESSPLNPLSPYALSKAEAEQMGRRYLAQKGLRSTHFRLFNVYGPHQDPHSPYSGVIAKFIQACMTGVSPIVFGTGKQSRDFLYIGDIGAPFLKVLETSSILPLVLNLGTGQAHTILEVLEILDSILNRKLKADYQPEREGDIGYSCADMRLCLQTLGFIPSTSFETGLKKTVEWAKSARSHLL